MELFALEVRVWEKKHLWRWWKLSLIIPSHGFTHCLLIGSRFFKRIWQFHTLQHMAKCWNAVSSLKFNRKWHTLFRSNLEYYFLYAIWTEYLELSFEICVITVKFGYACIFSGVTCFWHRRFYLKIGWWRGTGNMQKQGRMNRCLSGRLDLFCMYRNIVLQSEQWLIMAEKITVYIVVERNVMSHYKTRWYKKLKNSIWYFLSVSFLKPNH